MSTFPTVSKTKTSWRHEKKKERLGEEGHAELHKKELRGDMRKGESHLGRDPACRGSGGGSSESGQDERLWRLQRTREISRRKKRVCNKCR